MTISHAARAAGVGVETVRFYERRGLIVRPSKSPDGGFRLYPPETVERVRFIRQAQGLGFDGIVFTGFVAVVLAFAAFPDSNGNIRLGLVVAGSGTLLLFAGLLGVLAWHKRRMQVLSGRMFSFLERLPLAIGTRLEALLLSFADGIVWPQETWRRASVLLASVVIKLIATTHFLWAGGADPIDYIFLLVFAGFAHIIAHAVRVPGGFILGSIFALGLLHVPEEEAAAMVLTVQIASMATVAAIGAVALWHSGVALSDLRARPAVGATFIEPARQGGGGG